MAVELRTRQDKERAATALQDELIDKAVLSTAAGRHSLIEAPTASGKSRIYNRLAKLIGEQNKRVFIAAHRCNLITQGAENYDKWNKAGFGETTIGMDGEIDQRGRTVFSTIQTASSENILPTLERYDVLIIDEAHHATTKNKDYNALIARLQKENPDLLVIGVTATPPEQLKGLHATLANADHHVATFEQVVEAGLVVIPETVRPRILLQTDRYVSDVVEQHRASERSTDFETGISRDLHKLLPANWNEEVADVYEQHLGDRRSIGFFDRIKDAEEFNEEIRGRKYDMALIHSRMGDTANKKALRAFQHGDYAGLLSVDMISEGYDVPACEGVLLAKMQTSDKELRQIFGRTARGLGGEERTRKPLLVDVGASTLIHGELGAIAHLQSLRGDIDRDVVDNVELLPGKSSRAFTPWIAMPTASPASPQVFGTSIDGRLIYASETSKGFVAVTTDKSKKGEKVVLFEVPGNTRKGVIEPHRLGEWMRSRIPTNERALAQMTSKIDKGVSRLESLLKDDFDRNGPSISRMVQMMSMPPIPRSEQMVAGWHR